MSKTLIKEIKVYEFMRRNIGRNFLGCDLKRIFQFSYKTPFHKTRLRKYTMHLRKSASHQGAPHLYEILDMVWVSQDFINKNKIPGSRLWGLNLGLNLVQKINIPWHLLAEHGGSITDHELQKRFKEKYE